VALAVLTAAAWVSLGALRIIHHQLNIRWLVRQAEQAVKDAARDQP